MARDRIIGVALLTAQDLDRLGQGFDRWYPVDETPCFRDLLAAIDDADRELIRERERVKISPSNPAS